VKEHLELYAAVKGVPKCSLPVVVDDMVMSLGLKDKIETRAAYLSGGMQRKLQVLHFEMSESSSLCSYSPVSFL
jgi:ABC-type multidrug transport system ATPase subunit